MLFSIEVLSTANCNKGLSLISEHKGLQFKNLGKVILKSENVLIFNNLQ